MPKKILVIRLSSIGDILLTTPVLRCLKEQTGAYIDFLTKEKYFELLLANPYVDKLIAYDKDDIGGLLEQLGSNKYDLLIDLHKNLRTLRIKQKLGAQARSFNKINWRKWLAVQTKNRSILPEVHVVDRYFGAVDQLGVRYDGEGLDYYFSANENAFLEELTEVSPDFVKLHSGRDGYFAVVLAAAHKTKAIPRVILSKIIGSLPMHAVLIGGPEYEEMAVSLENAHDNCTSFVGRSSIGGSAFILKKAAVVLTPDTGMMHLAAALKRPIVSLWGNTIPEFGMVPLLPDGHATDLQQRFEVGKLPCRPCSKIGFEDCPKGHFRCMMEQDVGAIVETIKRLYNYSGHQGGQT
jgi:ADP-heptose:LPS heptosyltransferase